MKDLANRAVVITGAASGIGRAAAMAFAREGATPLVIADIDAIGLDETASALARTGCDALAVPTDVTDRAAVQRLVDTALEHAGRIDVLVNVAGVGVFGPIEDLEPCDWEYVLGVDLWGVVNTVSAVYPHMVSRHEGHIVNVASSSGLFDPVLYLAPYVTAKFGVVGLSEALMLEGRVHGIGVSCICPGSVDTPIQDSTAIKGFLESSRTLTRTAFWIAEKPQDTARTIVEAVRKDRFIAVTTGYVKAAYFLRRHFPRAWFAYMRTFARVFAFAFRRYRA